MEWAGACYHVINRGNYRRDIARKLDLRGDEFSRKRVLAWSSVGINNLNGYLDFLDGMELIWLVWNFKGKLVAVGKELLARVRDRIRLASWASFALNASWIPSGRF